MSVTSSKEISLKKYYKIVFLGSVKVGKTSLIRRILDLEPMSEYSPTIGVRYHNLDVQQDENIQYYLQFWDVSGNEIYNDLIASVLRRVSIVVLVFDYTNKQSQVDFMQLYTKICETVSPAQILAIGNKAEKPKDNVPKKMTFWVKEHKLKIFPVSAKDNIGISLLLQTIMQEIENIPMVDSSEPIDVRVSPPTSE
ncbi:MAG: GTP-binding protein [Candidatus Hodarchaeales archaeon]